MLYVKVTQNAGPLIFQQHKQQRDSPLDQVHPYCLCCIVPSITRSGLPIGALWRDVTPGTTSRILKTFFKAKRSVRNERRTDVKKSLQPTIVFQVTLRPCFSPEQSCTRVITRAILTSAISLIVKVVASCPKDFKNNFFGAFPDFACSEKMRFCTHRTKIPCVLPVT